MRWVPNTYTTTYYEYYVVLQFTVIDKHIKTCTLGYNLGIPLWGHTVKFKRMIMD